MIRLLLVEDSVTQREILRKLIDASGKLVVVAEARNGREAVAAVARYRPDVVLMDIHMPDMDGVAATREIMKLTPVPIVVTSAALRQQEVDLGLEALKAGAVSVVEKPQGAVLLHLKKIAPLLCDELVGASKAKVVSMIALSRRLDRKKSWNGSPGQIEVIGMCASTGGPPVLLRILSQLPKSFPIPILLVQHIAAGFVPGFVRWLGDLSGQQVREALPYQELTPGIWISPGGKHLGVNQRGRIELTPPQSGEIHCPSGDALFHSLAQHYGPTAMGILLTGMGSDGAEGLRELRDAGGRTVAQDEETSLIFGMPKAAIDRGAADYQLPPAAIADLMIATAQTP
ncbi:chemotaxis-specific protein-glutamate methyltransferase CheB [Planctomicrobium sp. SH661]|uniref:chemotaxis-specific protein-glutamate methyltransferase CheB n=1 Tax=Planctomicrobium sp. SH661 TaxID=3448124 RepID=UPI003F5B19F7